MDVAKVIQFGLGCKLTLVDELAREKIPSAGLTTANYRAAPGVSRRWGGAALAATGTTTGEVRRLTVAPPPSWSRLIIPPNGAEAVAPFAR